MKQNLQNQKWFFHLLFVLLTQVFFSCAAQSKFPVSNHSDGQKFFNPGLSIDKKFTEFLKWSFNRAPSDYPEWIDNTHKPQLHQNLNETEIAVTFINHSSFFVETQNFSFLTDPVWSQRASPVSFAGPQRVRAPGAPLESLKQVDFVVVSHNHYDHMDIPTLKKIHELYKPTFIVPLGNKIFFQSIKNIKVIELDWWQSHEILLNPTSQKVKITLVPAQHWSARGMFDRNEALWGGFVIEQNNLQVYFAGDTGFNEELFKSIAQKFERLSLSFLPIGAYEPRWFLKEQHTNPAEALAIHNILKSNYSIAMHFGTFRLTDEKWGQPEADLTTALNHSQTQNFKILEVGQTQKFLIKTVTP